MKMVEPTTGTLQALTLDEDEVKDIPPRNLIAVNVPEKIVLCVDVTEEQTAVVTPFKFGDGTLLTPLAMIQRLVEMFMFGKSSINKNHEFALVVLKGEETLWITNFTKDPKRITRDLKDISAFKHGGPTFDMTMLFDVLKENLPLPTQTVPDFVPRVILIYGRAKCVPSFFMGRGSFDDLIQCPFITFDLLYIHEERSEENQVDDICEILMTALDPQGYSYLFQAVRNPKLVHDCMAKLLAHPLQRPMQQNAVYKFELLSNSQNI